MEESDKRLFDYDNVDLSHDGRCFWNSNLAPGSAETWAFPSLGKDLLIDPATGALRPDDEAIFADGIGTDSNTTGARKFISTPKECIGDATKDIAVQVPDIGHFIKCISNSLYKLADGNKLLKDKYLLEPLRIRRIAGDVKWHLKSFHNFWSDIKKKVSTTAKEKEDGKLDDATATC
jgi:hypothetical protein